MSYGWRTIGDRVVELCDECGFDARRVRNEADELARVFAALEPLLDHPDADRRPDPDTWSASEYVGHCCDVTKALLEYVARVLGTDPPGEVRDIRAAAAACSDVVPALTAADRFAVLEDEYPMPVTVEWIVRHLLHDLEHHVLAIGHGYARLARADHPVVHTVER